MVIMEEENYLSHYGILRLSGRYPWNSGGNNKTQLATNKRFLDFVEDMKKQGLTESEIAQGQGITIAQMRAAKTYARNEVKRDNIATAEKLAAKGMSGKAIATQMGLSGESAVRALRAPGEREKTDTLIKISDVLKEHVDRDIYVDIGSGSETWLNISKEKLAAAAFILAEQGYEIHVVPVPQIGTAFDTKTKVLVPPGVTQKDTWANRYKIKQISTQTDDGGRHFSKEHPLVSINKNRVGIKYGEDGGGQADGVIYVRPGKKDLSMGNNTYAQVRIKIGDDHYLKGMAVHKDDLPPGIDLLFNTNKRKIDYPNKLDTMKKLSLDKDLPFESVVRPVILNLGHPTKEQVISAINIVNDATDWVKWQDTLSSQVLSKQSPVFARQHLELTYSRGERKFDRIMKLTNPAVKKKLLNDFADTTDATAGHLKAAALPRQSWKVILPLESLKPSDIYAPSYRHGETVVLVRFPHGGKFEIPELIVNNKHPEGKKLLGDATTAIGIHPLVASRMSGADFDGDTVLVIPNASGKIKHQPTLKELNNFDPKHVYRPYDGMKTMDGGIYNTKTDTVTYEKPPNHVNKSNEMGKISNLITDMTIRGASNSELTRAVRHSMVVIDAEKHYLDYRRSKQDNNIRALEKEYQTNFRDNNRAGASTLISLKKGQVWKPELRGQPFPTQSPINKATGEVLQIETGKTKRNADGSVSIVEKKYKNIDLTNDVNTMSSGTAIEKHYADYANKQKALANKARLEAFKTPPIQWSQSAKRVYKDEVDSLNSKLTIAKKNRTLERHARVIAGAAIRARLDANPNLDRDTVKKIKYQELARARTRVKLDQTKIRFTDKEWQAIQQGAISNHKLKELLAKADMEQVNELATPVTKTVMTTTMTARARKLTDSGMTRGEIADILGVSLTTLDRSLSD